MTNSLIPYSFVPGTKAMASEVNANFLALANSVEEGRQYTNEAIENFNTELEAKLEEYGGLIDEKMNPDMSNSRNITNCLLEVPQRIKYTLEDGVLTVKAGSVIIIPYGTQNLSDDYPIGSTFINSNLKIVDTQFTGGKFFVWAEFVADRQMNSTSQVSATDRMMTCDLTNGVLSSVTATAYYSGETEPSGLSNSNRFYNTSTNYIYNVGTTNYHSFPLLIGHSTNGVGWTSIDQVFNGFGYIGSTAWMDKGVKGLSCDGRNSDGTLKNIDWTNSNLVTRTNQSGANLAYFQINANSLVDMRTHSYYEQDEEPVDATYSLWYKPSENIMRYRQGINSPWAANHVFLGITATSDSSGKITSFNPKQAFHAADIRQVEMLIKSFNTSSKAASGYVKLGDGIIIQWGIKTGQNVQAYSVTLPTAFSTTNYVPIVIDTSTSNGQSHCSVTGLTTTTFSGMHSSDGATIRWIAIGY